MKFSILDINKLKKNKIPIVAITAYDFISSQIINELEFPIILVGDSASNVVYGYSDTLPISIDEMLLIVRAVSRASNTSLVVADMPFMSYQPSIGEAITNAGAFIKRGGADAIKLEGGLVYEKHIREIVQSGIPVMGHIGLMPQSIKKMGKYKIQGKTQDSADKILKDAVAVERAGAFSVVLEGVPSSLAKKITSELSIPTIGIGAGLDCSGQIQVFHDVLGLYKNFIPKHSKVFSDVRSIMVKGLKNYQNSVLKKTFPNKKNENL